MKKQMMIAGAVAVLLALSACGEAAPNQEDEGASDEWTAVLEAAATESAPTVYTTDVNEWAEAVGASYSEQTGLQANIPPRVGIGEMLQRMDAEMASGGSEADVLAIADQTLWKTHPDWFMNLSEAGLPNYDSYPDSAKVDDVCVFVTFTPAGFVYNTDKVAAEDAPKTWDDLLDPQWQDQILITDPRVSPSYMSWAGLMADEYGIEYLEELADLNPTIADGASPAAQQVATGAFSLSVMSFVTNSSTLIASGAPLKFVVPEEGPSFGNGNCVGILADSKNPNAAKAFVNSLMSPESQSAGCTAAQNSSPLGAIEGCLTPPDGWTPTPIEADGSLSGLGDEAHQQDLQRALGLL